MAPPSIEPLVGIFSSSSAESPMGSEEFLSLSCRACGMFTGLRTCNESGQELWAKNSWKTNDFRMIVCVAAGFIAQ